MEPRKMADWHFVQTKAAYLKDGMNSQRQRFRGSSLSSSHETPPLSFFIAALTRIVDLHTPLGPKAAEF
jgi:hypothetical protein